MTDILSVVFVVLVICLSFIYEAPGIVIFLLMLGLCAPLLCSLGNLMNKH